MNINWPLKKDDYRYSYLLAIFFGLIYSLISLINHYNFRTHALDLGMFNQAIYSYSNFSPAYFTQGLNGESVDYLGDHFSVITIVLSPLRFVFGTFTLLIVQIVAMVIASIFLVKLSRYHLISPKFSFFLVLLFNCIWGTYAAISFDFHTNVIAACLLPALIYYHDKQSVWKFWIVFVAMILCKENISLWLFFIALGLLIRDKAKSMVGNRRILLTLTISAAYFYSVVFLIMPWLNAQDLSPTFKENFLIGDKSVTETMLHYLRNPSELFNSLFQNTQGNVSKSKILTWSFLGASGLVFTLLRPYYLLMLIPILAQKFLSLNGHFWDIHGQYSIEFVPLIVLAALDVVVYYKSSKTSFYLMVLFCISSYYCSYREVIKRNATNNFLSFDHYRCDLNRSEIEHMISIIPDNAVVSSSSRLAPHLSFRNKIFCFPVVNEADFVAITLKNLTTYPLTELEYLDRVKNVSESKDYQLLYSGNDCVLFRRID